jgi:flagellar basal-body rod modification protein FlgD
MSTVTSSPVNDAYALYGSSADSASASSMSATADSFLSLLVTQLQNQDPLNPMDNAELTSQMAQINTVTQLENVNGSVQSLGAQFLQMQTLQSASLVGHEVMIDGDRLTVSDGVGKGALVLVSPATAVTVEVKDGSGKVVGTLNLGALDAGLQDFEWELGGRPAGGAYTFSVTATNGGSVVEAAPLMVDRVTSVSNTSNQLTMTLEHAGTVPASAVVTYQ